MMLLSEKAKTEAKRKYRPFRVKSEKSLLSNVCHKTLREDFPIRIHPAKEGGWTRFITIHYSLFTSTITFFTVLILNLAGCDDSFHPIQDNPDLPFTIYGHLDASIDTNWVRVTPIRESLYLDTSVSTDAEVTLEHLETGETVVLKDSLFQLTPGVFVLNWQTNMQLEPTHSYRLAAKKPDGRSSSATVTLPDTFPDPIVEVGSTRASVNLQGIKNLADATVYYLVFDYINNSLVNITFNHLRDTVSLPMPPEHHQLTFNPGEHQAYIANFFFDRPYEIRNRWVYVASAGPEWIYFPAYDELTRELPDAITNIDGGAGFLIGVVSKKAEF